MVAETVMEKVDDLLVGDIDYHSALVDGVFWYTKHVRYTLVWI
jgi:hypothetical protein